MVSTKDVAKGILADPSKFGGVSGGVVHTNWFGQQTKALNKFIQDIPGGYIATRYDPYFNFHHSASAAWPESFQFAGQADRFGYMVLDQDPPLLATPLAEYFAKLFEHIAEIQFATPHGPVSFHLTLYDLWHGHFLTDPENHGAYILFHANEVPGDFPEATEVNAPHGVDRRGKFSMNTVTYKYRNLLWRGSQRDVWALDTSGELDPVLKVVGTKESSIIFKNFIVPLAFQTALDAGTGQYTLEFLELGIKGRKLEQNYFGFAHGNVNYRCGIPANTKASQKVVFAQEETTVFRWIETDDVKIHQLRGQQREPTPDECKTLYRYH